MYVCKFPSILANQGYAYITKLLTKVGNEKGSWLPGSPIKSIAFPQKLERKSSFQH